MPPVAFPKRAIHLDFHTMPAVDDVGRDFNPAEFADTLARAEVDYITVFARCNLGFAYYPTKIGTVHPGLHRELLGPMVKACHKRGIRVAAYVNAGIDHEHALRHREWCKVNKEGQVYQFQRMGHWFRNPCLNTGYGDHLAGMVEEILTRYPVDGIFLDCFDLSPCHGVECLDGMKARGLDPLNGDHAGQYTAIVTRRFMARIRALVKRIRPGIYLYFNGLPYAEEPTHLELEILPTGGWGYDILPATIRYARTLRKPYFLMTGRFHASWGDFGGIRTEPSLLFDCLCSLSQGGTCSVGDHLHPRGRLDRQVYDRIGSVYRQVKAIEPWVDGAKPVVDMAVVDPLLARFPSASSGALDNVRGAARLLSELKCQFDVCDGRGDWSRYKTIILPDRVTLAGELKDKAQRHVDRGGVLISSGWAGMNPEKTRFALPAYKLDYQGAEPYNVAFFNATPEVSRDLPDMPTTIYEPGIAMAARRGARLLARLIRPYFNKKSWDGYHENLYVPPDRDSGRAALARMGTIAHFSFPIFSAYFNYAVPAYKYLLRNLLAQLDPAPIVKVGNFPSFGQVSVMRKGARRLIHLIAYVPEQRGASFQMIEEPITVTDVRVSLRTGGKRVRKATLALCGTPLNVETADGYVTISVPEVKGYQLVVVE